MCFTLIVFFVKQKTAYELRISDWSSDVCSSDLRLIDDPEIDEEGVDQAAAGEEDAPSEGAHDDGGELRRDQQEDHQPGPSPRMAHQEVCGRIAEKDADRREGDAEEQ